MITIFNGIINVSISSDMIDAVSHEVVPSQGDRSSVANQHRCIMARFRDGVLLTLDSYDNNSRITATFSSPSFAITMPIEEVMYDEILKMLRDTGYTFL